MAKLSIRIDLDPGGRLGPGKVALLEQIEAQGSISAAGRAMGMSYKRAWDLVAALNAAFRTPLVQAQMGGRHGGGAALTSDRRLGNAEDKDHLTLRLRRGGGAGSNVRLRRSVASTT